MAQRGQQLYDPIRQQWVADTPEERVRQATLCWLLEEGGYVQEHLIVERVLPPDLFPTNLASSSEPLKQRSKRRLDIACLKLSTLTEPGKIYLLIECKANLKSPAAKEQAMRQVIGYHWSLQASALAIASVEGRWHCYTSHPETWYEGLPSKSELDAAANSRP